MARIRTDNVFGTLTDNPLTNVATTMNSAGLANLAVVAAPDEAILILDPNRLTGAPEIVVVTAHTGSATSATIQRGQFGTAARQHALGTQWIHGPIAGNTAVFTTPADDQGDFVPLGAWASWTPTLSNLTLGNGTVTAKYVRIGRTIQYRFKFVLGSTSAVAAAGTKTFSLPVAAHSEYSATATLGDASLLGATVWRGMIWPASSGTLGRIVYFKADGTSADLSSTLPHTWAAGHVMEVSGAYEAAS